MHDGIKHYKALLIFSSYGNKVCLCHDNEKLIGLGVCYLLVCHILKFNSSPVLKARHEDLKLLGLMLLRLLGLALWTLLSSYTLMAESFIGEGEADMNTVFL